MRSPVKTGLVMIRVRMAWIRSNISRFAEYAVSAMPYSRSAFGVLPPLWSRAAMKPLPVCIFWNCSVFTAAPFVVQLC